jgi:hypothetical protein
MNWRGARPDTSDGSANFIAGITAPCMVTVDIPATVGSLSFAGNEPYTLAGSQPLTVDVISGTATIDVTTPGSHGITAPLTLVKNTDITVAAGGSLTITNLQATAANVVKKGAGALNVDSVRAASLNVQAGVVNVIASYGGATASKVSSLTIAAGTKLDLADNKLVVTGANVGSASGGIYSGIQGLVQQGTTAAVGLTTWMPDAQSGLTTLAVARAQDVGYAGGMFGGVSVASGDVLVMYTYMGDANLDGFISGDDYTTIDFNTATPGAAGYGNGDFNYDGIISGDDYAAIDFNIVAQGAPFPTSAAAGSIVAVPEPAAFGLVMLLATNLRRKRRIVQ